MQISNSDGGHKKNPLPKERAESTPREGHPPDVHIDTVLCQITFSLRRVLMVSWPDARPFFFW